MRADLGSGRVEMLTARVSADDLLAPNSSIDYANDVAVAKSGLIYFTDSARGVIPVRNAEGFWDTMQAYMLTLYHVRALLCLVHGGLMEAIHVCSLFCGCGQRWWKVPALSRV